jgi:hypothetical protein
MKLLDKSSGTWEEERLLLWRIVGDLEEAQAEEVALRKKQSDAAHAKIRELKWKTWAALIPSVAVIVVEVLKLLFARH